MNLRFTIHIPDIEFAKLLAEAGRTKEEFRNDIEQMAFEVLAECPGAKLTAEMLDDGVEQALGRERSAIFPPDDQEPEDSMSPEARASMEEARKEWKPGGAGKITLLEKMGELKSGQWWEWSAEMELPGGRTVDGTVQSDGHVIARETWAPN